MESVELYARLKALIHEWPAFEGRGKLDAETHEWLGKADALIAAANNGADSIIFGNAVGALGANSLHDSNVATIRAILYRTLARAELQVPVPARGAFIAAGSSFAVLAALSKVLVKATADVLIVDPYLDAVALTDVAVLVPEGIPVRLMGDAANKQANLAPALARWKLQYTTTRPIEVRLSAPRALHDRMIFVDGKEAWSLSQSIKDFANRAHASIERSTPEIGAEKKLAYDNGIWGAATLIA